LFGIDAFQRDTREVPEVQNLSTLPEIGAAGDEHVASWEESHGTGVSALSFKLMFELSCTSIPK